MTENKSEELPTGKTGGIQVIARAANILRTLKDHPNGLSLAQIARRVGLARSTVQRIIIALEEEGFVVPASASSGFRLGPAISILSTAVRIDLREEVKPYLQQLSDEVDETVDLAILDNDKIVFIDQIKVAHRLQAVSQIGGTFPLHCTANGKAILATLPIEEVYELIPETLEPYTPNTLKTRDRLLKELEEVRKTGVAYDREEHTVGICSVGAIIRDPLGNVGAVTIPVPAIRFYGNEDRLVSALLNTCEQINQRFLTLGQKGKH